MQEVSDVNNARNVVPLAATDAPLQKATRAMMAMEQFLGEQYDLRFNKLTSRNSGSGIFPEPASSLWGSAS